MRLFVYGTLKQGYGNNRLLSDAEFLGKDVVQVPYYLVDLGPFPAAIPSDQVHEIIGEVYQINDEIMERTDWLEGYPEHYNRSEIPTSFGDAWIYHYHQLPRYMSEPAAIKEWHK